MKDIYIDSVMTINNNQNKFRKINNITNYEDKVYIYAYKDDTSHEISLSKLDNLDNYKNIYDELKNKKIEQVTNTYSILRTPSVLYIYFPTKTVNTNDNDNLFFAYECSINQEKKYYIDYYFGLDTKLKMGTYGDYYIILENFSPCDIDSEIKFSLIKIR